MGAICRDCKGDMLLVNGCTAKYIKDEHGNRIKRNLVGVNDWTKSGERCQDCGARSGYHHYGCDIERCPLCGGQLIGCECFEED